MAILHVYHIDGSDPLAEKYIYKGPIEIKDTSNLDATMDIAKRKYGKNNGVIVSDRDQIKPSLEQNFQERGYRDITTKRFPRDA